MTTYNKTSLKTFFETGDVPTGTNYADLIDSQVNLVETAIQAMAGPLSVTEIISPRASATNINVTGILSAANANITGVVTAGGLKTTADVSADSVTVYASVIRSTNGLIGGTPTIISAAGTAQGTAATLTAFINIGAGIADGATTGFAPLANRAGLVQYIINGGASANLWPPTGGYINALATNAAFGMAASTLYTIIHRNASAYAVK